MNISALFIPLITLVTAQITVMDLAKFRFGRKKLLIIVLIELVLQVCVSGALLLFFGYDQYAKWYLFTMLLPSALTFFYVSERRDSRDIFTFELTVFLNFMISIPAMWVMQYNDRNNVWYNITRIILFSLLFILMHNVVRKRYIQIQEEIGKGWLMFSILPLIGITNLYYQYLIYSRTGDFSGILMNCTMTVLLLAAVFVVFNYVFSLLHEKYLVQEQKNILAMQNKAQYDQFEQQKEAAEKTNRRWHDLRHNIQELIELLEEGDTRTALTYLKEQRGVDEIPRQVYCLHAEVNSILCLWAERSRRADINVEISTDVPEALNIEPMELTALFANAFENAFQGCLRLPKKAGRFIKVDANYNGRRLAIGFTNSCAEDIHFVNHIPVSQKTGGGIGTRSIAYTVERYKGTVYFDAKNGVFTARFILNI